MRVLADASIQINKCSAASETSGRKTVSGRWTTCPKLKVRRAALLMKAVHDQDGQGEQRAPSALVVETPGGCAQAQTHTYTHMKMNGWLAGGGATKTNTKEHVQVGVVLVGLHRYRSAARGSIRRPHGVVGADGSPTRRALHGSMAIDGLVPRHC